MIRRRGVIKLAGGAAVWPWMARGQDTTLPLIGYLDAGSNGAVGNDEREALLKALAAAGYYQCGH